MQHKLLIEPVLTNGKAAEIAVGMETAKDNTQFKGNDAAIQ